MGLAPSRVAQIAMKMAIARCLSHFFNTLLGMTAAFTTIALAVLTVLQALRYIFAGISKSASS